MDIWSVITILILLAAVIAWLFFSDKIVRLFKLEDPSNPSWTFGSDKQ